MRAGSVLSTALDFLQIIGVDLTRPETPQCTLDPIKIWTFNFSLFPSLFQNFSQGTSLG